MTLALMVDEWLSSHPKFGKHFIIGKTWYVFPVSYDFIKHVKTGSIVAYILEDRIETYERAVQIRTFTQPEVYLASDPDFFVKLEKHLNLMHRFSFFSHP